VDSKASAAEAARPLREFLAEFVPLIRFGVMNMTELAEGVGSTHVLSTEDMVELFTWMTTPTAKPKIKWSSTARNMASLPDTTSSSAFTSGASAGSNTDSSGRVADDRRTKRGFHARDADERDLASDHSGIGLFSSGGTGGFGSGISSSSSSSGGSGGFGGFSGFGSSSPPTTGALFSTKPKSSAKVATPTATFGQGQAWGNAREDEELRRAYVQHSYSVIAITLTYYM
jgi:hypothetical protein